MFPIPSFVFTAIGSVIVSGLVRRLARNRMAASLTIRLKVQLGKFRSSKPPNKEAEWPS